MTTISEVAVELIPATACERRRPGAVARGLTLAYGLASYVAFLAAFLYAMGFVGNWGVPKGIDTGASGAVVPSLLINAALLAGFVLQHTIMARPAFKRWWTKIVPKPIERSTYVWMASACLGLIFWQWRPLTQTVWSVGGLAGSALAVVSLMGWAIVLVASFAISHMDLFGVRQTWLEFKARTYRPVGFRLVGFYKLIRHPLMVGFLIAFWATPVMSVGHLFFAGMTTGYILFGTWMEERDLVAEHGESYLEYRRRVPGFIPGTKRGIRHEA
jgi:protein-S-isoprenylcysteine O-methyltransferase Ste14